MAALITGASSGIGYELALVFARHGHDVVLVARREELLRELANRIRADHQVTATVVAKDLARSQAGAELREVIAAEGIQVDVLVNNAGFSIRQVRGYSAPERAGHDLGQHRSTHHAHQAVLPPMLGRHSGRILNVASTAAFQPGPWMAVYYGTKAYVLSFSEALAEELDGSGVSVTALCPGATRTGFQARGLMEDSRLVQGEIARAHSVAEFGYRALMANRRVAIPGLRNRLLAQSVRFTPRRLVTRLVKWAQEPVSPKNARTARRGDGSWALWSSPSTAHRPGFRPPSTEPAARR